MSFIKKKLKQPVAGSGHCKYVTPYVAIETHTLENYYEKINKFLGPCPTEGHITRDEYRMYCKSLL